MKKLVHVLACFIVTASSVVLAQGTTSPDNIKKDIYRAFDKVGAVIVDCPPELTVEAKKLEAVYSECFKTEDEFRLFRIVWDLSLPGYEVIQPWKEVGKNYTRIYQKSALYLKVTFSSSIGTVIVTPKAP